MGKVIFVEGTEKVHKMNWWWVVGVLAVVAFGIFVYRPDLIIMP